MNVNHPNIVYILADDLGFGDLSCNNPESKIPTKHLDRMAERGIRFTNAHASSSVCTPSRYSILTGEYCWRTPLKDGVLWAYDAPLIKPGTPTIASFLRDNGYDTHAIGKWHLGMEWFLKDGTPTAEKVKMADLNNFAERCNLDKEIDYTARINGGPVDHGFNHYFGIDVPNFPPYTWFVDDGLGEIPTIPKTDEIYGHSGYMIPGWKHENMLPEFTKRAKQYIYEQGETDNPFFLYLALTSPHTPVCPNEEFKGCSGAGLFGDFVVETDWVVGQVMEALEATGQLENTLVIFTADNGPEGSPALPTGAYERIQEYEHFSMGELRGIKRDAWEAGHRVPYLVQWPARCPLNTCCDETICLGDLFATCAEILGKELPDNAAQDSVSHLPLLNGENKEVRDHLIHHTCNGQFAIRQGDWVFIDAPNGDNNYFEDRKGWTGEPQWFRDMRGIESHNEVAELYNLKEDIGETKNRFADEPERAKKMAALLRTIQGEHAQYGCSELPNHFLSE